jgi:hypothetical protein
MALIPDQGAVQELAPASPVQRSVIAFMRGVRMLQSAVRMPASARTASNAAVKFDPRSRIMNLTRCACSPGFMIRLRACCAVHSPVGCRSGSEDADAPGGVLGHGQDMGLGAVGQVSREEVACHDHLGLGAQKLRPGRRGSARRRVDSGLLENFPYRRRRYRHSQAGQLAVDPAVPPFRILAGQPEDWGLDVPAGRRPAGLAAVGPGGPAAAGDVAVPAQDRVRGDQQPQSPAARFRYHTERGGEQGPVRPLQLRATRLPLLQDRELMAQDQDLGGLPRLLTPGQPQPCDLRGQEENEPQAHDR